MRHNPFHAVHGIVSRLAKPFGRTARLATALALAVISLAHAGTAWAGSFAPGPSGNVIGMMNYGTSRNGTPNGAPLQFCGAYYNEYGNWDVQCVEPNTGVGPYSLGFSRTASAAVATVTQAGYWAVDSAGYLYLGTSSVAITQATAYKSPPTWRRLAQLPTYAKQISNDNTGAIFVLGTNGRLYAYNQSANTFTALAQSYDIISFGWSPSYGGGAIVGLSITGNVLVLAGPMCLQYQGCGLYQWQDRGETRTPYGYYFFPTCQKYLNANPGWNWTASCTLTSNGAYIAYWIYAAPTSRLEFYELAHNGGDELWGTDTITDGSAAQNGGNPNFSQGLGFEWPGPGAIDDGPPQSTVSSCSQPNACIAPPPINSLLEGPFATPEFYYPAVIAINRQGDELHYLMQY